MNDKNINHNSNYTFSGDTNKKNGRKRDSSEDIQTKSDGNY